MSLVWHGFWSGYVIIFMGTAVMDVVYKQLRRTTLVHAIKAALPRPLYIVLWFPINRFIFSFVTFSFHYQFWERYSVVYAALNWSGWYILLTMFIASFVLPKKRADKVKEGDKPKAE